MTENGNGWFGKVAVVTGASRGLGRNMAKHVAGAGMAVVGTYRGGKDEADALVTEIEGAGGRAVALRLDVSKSDTFGDFASALGETLEGDFDRSDFDVLINNAGIGINAPFAEMTEEQFDQLIKINLKVPFFLTQKLLPMIADGGRVLNVSSGLARFTNPGLPPRS